MKKIIILLISGGLLALDLITKSWIQLNLALGQSIQVIPGFFDITYLQNTGAAWGMFDGPIMRPIFLLISVGVTVTALYYFFKEENLLLLTGIGLIIAGNTGNFYDRLMLHYVRDMLSFNIFGYAFPVFNVADVCLVVGFGVLFLYMFLEEKRNEEHE